MTITIDITSAIENIARKIDADKILRTVVNSTLPIVKERIHVDGKNASGEEIGTYKNSYLKLRQKKYNRDANEKVIFSLTRQMENDFSVIATQKGYGLGYNNSLNFDKAKWLEEKYKKTVFGLTDEEQDTVMETAKFEALKLLNE